MEPTTPTEATPAPHVKFRRLVVFTSLAPQPKTA
jgi:hypothetical protein